MCFAISNSGLGPGVCGIWLYNDDCTCNIYLSCHARNSGSLTLRTTLANIFDSMCSDLIEGAYQRLPGNLGLLVEIVKSIHAEPEGSLLRSYLAEIDTGCLLIE